MNRPAISTYKKHGYRVIEGKETRYICTGTDWVDERIITYAIEDAEAEFGVKYRGFNGYWLALEHVNEHMYSTNRGYDDADICVITAVWDLITYYNPIYGPNDNDVYILNRC